MQYGIRSAKTDDLTSFLADIDTQIREAEKRRTSLRTRIVEASEIVKEDIELLYEIRPGSSDSVVSVVDIIGVLDDPNLIHSVSYEIHEMKVTVQLARTNTDYTPPYGVLMTILYKGIPNYKNNQRINDIQELPDCFKQLFLEWCKGHSSTVRDIRAKRT